MFSPYADGVHPFMLIPRDKSAVAGQRLSRKSLPRVGRFAAPYKAAIIGFVGTILVGAIVALVPPFLFRRIVDDAIPQANRGLIVTLTVILVVAAFGDALLQIVQR